MSVLVLGAGYIGAALIASHLQSGDRVVAMDNGFATDWDAIGRLMDGGPAKLVRGDIRDAASVASVISNAWPVRVVYLLAAQASANPDAATPEYTEETTPARPGGGQGCRACRRVASATGCLWQLIPLVRPRPAWRDR